MRLDLTGRKELTGGETRESKNQRAKEPKSQGVDAMYQTRQMGSAGTNKKDFKSNSHPQNPAQSIRIPQNHSKGHSEGHEKHEVPKIPNISKSLKNKQKQHKKNKTDLFQLVAENGEHEQVVFCNDPKSGLKAIIAIHSTHLGPALGGCRMWSYEDGEAALLDALRLSKGMTYKAAIAGVNLGGGKAVIIGDPKKGKTEAIFRSFGLFVHSLGGRYITAEDVGTSVSDMEYVFMETPWVTGIPSSFGGSGDPSPYTAQGVFMGIKAVVQKAFHRSDLQGTTVAVQGLGNVGLYLVQFLLKAGVKVIVADIDEQKVRYCKETYGEVEVVSPQKILSTKCDVLAPCALGAVFNEKTLPHLKCKAIAGGANNQLESNDIGESLRRKGILYAPDYVINAGGLMNVFVELEGYSKERALAKTRKVYDNLIRVFEVAEKQNIPTNLVADRLAEERIELIGGLKKRYLAEENPKRGM